MDPTMRSDGTLSVVVVGEDSRSMVREADLSGRAEVTVSTIADRNVEGALESITAADLVVGIGESAIHSLVRSGMEKPVLPVGSGGGLESVEPAALGEAIDDVLAGAHSIRTIPGLAVRAAADRYRGLMDVMAVTADAAKISEYQIASLDGEEEVVLDRVRADGVVAAAPAGTPGYGTAAGGPVLDPSLQAMTVVPVGPFRIENTHWVLELPLRIRVVREEVPVSLQVDDQEVGTLDAGTGVEISWGTPIEFVVTSVSGSGLGPREIDARPE